MIKDMKLSSKLICGFAVVQALFLIAMGIYTYSLSSTRSGFGELVSGGVRCESASL